MDWTIFWTIFWTNFLTIFWTIFFTIFLDNFEGGSTPLVLRKGRMKYISTKGGVGGGVLLLREGCETDYYYAGRDGRWL